MPLDSILLYESSSDLSEITNAIFSRVIIQSRLKKERMFLP